jgi:Xaa-Pro aminopeptidase
MLNMNNAPLSPTPPSTLPQHARRHEALMQTMRQQTGGGIAIIRTAPEVPRNGDADFPYRYDSDFYYLTGFSEPEAVLVLNAAQDTVKRRAQGMLITNSESAVL